MQRSTRFIADSDVPSASKRARSEPKGGPGSGTPELAFSRFTPKQGSALKALYKELAAELGAGAKLDDAAVNKLKDAADDASPRRPVPVSEVRKWADKQKPPSTVKPRLVKLQKAAIHKAATDQTCSPNAPLATLSKLQSLVNSLGNKKYGEKALRQMLHKAWKLADAAREEEATAAQSVYASSAAFFAPDLAAFEAEVSGALRTRECKGPFFPQEAQ